MGASKSKSSIGGVLAALLSVLPVVLMLKLSLDVQAQKKMAQETLFLCLPLCFFFLCVALIAQSRQIKSLKDRLQDLEQGADDGKEDS